MVGEDEPTHRWGSVAIRPSGQLILVGTGYQGSESVLLEDMKKKGIDRETADIVIFAHIHPDHVAWNLTGGKPNFPKDRHLIPEVDWDYWTQPDVMANAQYVAEQAVPLKGLNILDLIKGEYKITDELTTLPTPGHFPDPGFGRFTRTQGRRIWQVL